MIVAASPRPVTDREMEKAVRMADTNTRWSRSEGRGTNPSAGNIFHPQNL